MKIASIVIFAYAVSAYAELYPTANLKGFYLQGPTSISALELRPGTVDACTKSSGVSGKFNIHKCQLKDSAADITGTADLAGTRFKFNALSVIEYIDTKKPEDVEAQFYYKGMWEHEFQGTTISSPAILMIYRRKGNPNLFRGMLELDTYGTKGAVELK